MIGRDDKLFRTGNRTTNDVRRRLESCRLGVISLECLNPSDQGDARTWKAETTNGTRWIWWDGCWRVSRENARAA